MRRFIRFLLFKPILWFVENFSSAPDRERVFSSLTKLMEKIRSTAGRKGFVIPFDHQKQRFIIFSDQHKGRKNGADDFALAEPQYLAALDYYLQNNFHLISLGDSEELWENTLLQVRKCNALSFSAEAKFAAADRFTKIFGNHDLDWDIDPLAPVYLKDFYKLPVVVLEGVMLETTVDNKVLHILCTHGHQGDMQSDGNWFSKFFIAKIWAPLQAYLKINPNTPAYEEDLKTVHNRMMYEWSARQENLILITGHTHQPVFESLTHIERVRKKQKQDFYTLNKEWAEAIELELSWSRAEHQEVREDYLRMKPTYFNSGCCCFDEGVITGIEIADGRIRLIKWQKGKEAPERVVLEESLMTELASQLNDSK